MKIKRLALLSLVTVLIACTAFLFAFNGFAGNSSTGGDANSDGEVGLQDLVKLCQYLAWYDYDKGESTTTIDPAADIDGDGEITALDLYALRRYLVDGDFVVPQREPKQDNAFDAKDFMAAYNYSKPDGFTGELVTENGVTFFRATATAATSGKLVLNSGNNAVANIGKQFVIVYRNKTASISRFNLQLNSAGKTDGSGGAAPFYSISKSESWQAVYFSTSNPVDLTNGAGYIALDLFSTNNSGSVVTSVGDVMEIALFAAVDSKATAENMVYEYCGAAFPLSYMVNIPGVYAYGAEHKGSDVLPGGQQMTDKPIEMDLSNLPIGGTLTNALRLGSGWAITRGGWDYYECKITDSDGNSKVVRIYEGKDIGESTLNALSSYKGTYGEDMGIGGNLFDRIAIDLTGYEGKTLTIEVYGISNYGASYKIANIKNVRVLGVDNSFNAHDFYLAYKNTPANNTAAYTGELVYEGGVPFFRATLTKEGDKGRIILNTGNVIEGAGKHYILVYRGSSVSNSQKFQLYVNNAGNSTIMVPGILKTNESEWKIALLDYTTNATDISAGVTTVQVDLFWGSSTGGSVGDYIDVALFAAVDSVDAAWDAFADELGDKIKLPYKVNIGGVVINGVTYNDATVLPDGNSNTNAPVYMDLSNVTFAASSNLTDCLKLGSGWAITRGGWDYYLCTITASSGKTATFRVSEGSDFPANGGTLTSLKNTYEKDYGPDLAVGGNIMPPVYMYIDLTGFEGEKVSVDVIGVSNYGQQYNIAKIANVNVPGIAYYNAEDDFISFVDTTVATKLQSLSLSGGNTAGVSFTVPQGEEVRSIKINLLATNPGNAINKCSAKISVYAFNGSYADSVKTTPVLQKTVTSVIKWVDVEVAKGIMTAGNYLVVVEYAAGGSTVSTTAVLDNAWVKAPKNLEKYNITSYVNGSLNSTAILAGGIETVKIGSSIPANDTIDAEFADTTAKVIVIAGQSNAAGIAHNNIFKTKVGEDVYQKYANGFPNVKILYKVGGLSTTLTISYTNVSNGFVDVTIGQGYISSTFGPELGLAAYLAENYPDETFYIIKYAVGSSSMDNHWQVNDASKRQCYNDLLTTVNNGLELLEAEGLEPEILGFCWMQGEGDANTAANRANTYYEYEKALITAFRQEYAEYAVDGDILFIDAEISDSGFWAASYIVNDYKKDIDRESGRNILIDTNYLGLTTLYDNTDYAHYDSESMIVLGNAYANALCSVYNFSK